MKSSQARLISPFLLLLLSFNMLHGVDRHWPNSDRGEEEEGERKNSMYHSDDLFYYIPCSILSELCTQYGLREQCDQMKIFKIARKKPQNSRKIASQI